jgi:hypothetical protein
VGSDNSGATADCKTFTIKIQIFSLHLAQYSSAILLVTTHRPQLLLLLHLIALLSNANENRQELSETLFQDFLSSFTISKGSSERERINDRKTRTNRLMVEGINWLQGDERVFARSSDHYSLRHLIHQNRFRFQFAFCENFDCANRFFTSHRELKFIRARMRFASIQCFSGM